jgi:hypothetical protein
MGVRYIELEDGLLALKLERLSQEHLEEQILSIVE